MTADDTSRTNARTATQQFHSIQAQRKERFLTAYNLIAQEIDKVYKDLTQVFEGPAMYSDPS